MKAGGFEEMLGCCSSFVPTSFKTQDISPHLKANLQVRVVLNLQPFL